MFHRSLGDFRRASTRWMLGMWLAVAGLGCREVASGAQDELARLIVGRMKQPRGIALDVGCGDAGLALALARQVPGLRVHCVDPDGAVIAEARRSIALAGLYGTRITASQDAFQPLNYPDCCASLIICGDEFAQGRRGRNLKELYRVLSPNGIAWIGQRTVAGATAPLTRETLQQWLDEAEISSYEIIEEQGIWARITRVRDPGWDEWTHRGHDAANTFGSNDTIRGRSFKPLWISDFRPGLSSAAVAVAGGRVILASLSYDAFPEATPYLEVLDAYTGTELWARVGKRELPIERRPGTYSNRESCCDMVVVGEELFLLGGRFCHVFDLASGELKRSLEIPREAAAKEGDVWLYLSCVGDVLYGAVGPSPETKVDWNTMHYRGVATAVFALEPTSGRLRWISRTPASVCSLAVGDEQLYFCDPGLNLRALDARTAKPLWTARLPYPAGTEIAGCAFYREKVWLLYNQPQGTDRKGQKLLGQALINAGHNARELDAYSARSGEHLFRGDLGLTVAGVSFAAGKVFGTRQHSKGMAILDADTGARIALGASTAMKCTPSLGAAHCFFTQAVQEGASGYPAILDLSSLDDTSELAKARWNAFSGFRPSCSYPGIPANGMIYFQAEGCHCVSPVRGNIALIPGEPPAVDSGERLVTGPALRQPIDEAARPGWTTWRADPLRSGQTEERVAGRQLLWSRKLPGRLTPLCAAGGRVFVASAAHQVFALDASSGEPRWQRIVEGAVRVAPMLWRGRLYLSDDAGWAWCLRAVDGETVWRFRAALGKERILGDGEPMSRWPSRAGVLVDDGVAYFAAGLFPDEGTAVYAVDARSGAFRWEKQLSTAHAGSRTAGYVPAGAMALAHNRLYLSSGFGTPWQIELDDPERKVSSAIAKGTRQRVKGRDIMVMDGEVFAVAPGLQFVHHAGYKSYLNPSVAPLTAETDPDPRLPVVTADTVYLLNQTAGGKEPCLVAGKREAYEVQRETTVTLIPKKLQAGVDREGYVRWKAWPNQPMATIIRAADTIFTGGHGKVYATRAADGAELWSAAVPGQVEDLAVAGGRLFVQCDSGSVLCFGKSR